MLYVFWIQTNNILGLPGAFRKEVECKDNEDARRHAQIFNEHVGIVHAAYPKEAELNWESIEEASEELSDFSADSSTISHGEKIVVLPSGKWSLRELYAHLGDLENESRLRSEEEYQRFNAPQSFRAHLTVPISFLTRWLGEHSPSTLEGLVLEFPEGEKYRIKYASLSAARPFFQLEKVGAS